MKNDLKHLAIIMDGNGRWAKQRALARSKGHEAGARQVEMLCRYCLKNSISKLSLFAFSTENWQRPKLEVEFLLDLLKNFLISKQDSFLEHDIKFKAIGDLSIFSDEIKNLVIDLEEKTKNFSKLSFNLAINYGGKDEIIRAFRKILQDSIKIDTYNNTQKNTDLPQIANLTQNKVEISHDVKNSELEKLDDMINLASQTLNKIEQLNELINIFESLKNIDESILSANLDESEDIDLLIRTGGDCRISNFMLWQASYAELAFSPTLFPDFSEFELDQIIKEYKLKHRRFGGL